MEKIPEKDRETFVAVGAAEREWNVWARVVPHGPSTRPAKTVSQSRNRPKSAYTPLKQPQQPTGESPAEGPEHGGGWVRTVAPSVRGPIFTGAGWCG